MSTSLTRILPARSLVDSTRIRSNGRPEITTMSTNGTPRSEVALRTPYSAGKMSLQFCTAQPSCCVAFQTTCVKWDGWGLFGSYDATELREQIAGRGTDCQSLTSLVRPRLNRLIDTIAITSPSRQVLCIIVSSERSLRLSVTTYPRMGREILQNA